MKLTEKISWLMGRVQRSLFPHLNECLPPLLTEQEKRLVSILESVEVERHVPRNVARYRYPGRKPLDRQALPVNSWPKRCTVIRRPVTCIVPCSRQSTCAGSVDLELQVPYRRRPPFRGLLPHLPPAIWATWCRCVGGRIPVA